MSCINLLGKRFGMWKIHSLAYIGQRGTYWNCICNCGSFDVVNGSSLTCGNSKSCGCVKNLNFKKGEAAFRMLVHAYKASAKRRNYEFKLQLEECRNLFLNNCYYCGSKPFSIYRIPEVNGIFIYNGIDRLDNTKGYSLDNCVTCCKICNYAKQSMSLKEFKTWILKVCHHLCL